MTIPVMKPWLGADQALAASQAVESGCVAQGPRVASFERAFSDRVGVRFGVAVSSCTTALHLALHLVRVGRGDDVVVGSFSFIPTTKAVRYVGAQPVLAGAQPELQLTRDQALAKLAERGISARAGIMAARTASPRTPATRTETPR